MVRVHRILVATDFGEASAAALEYARTIAASFGATMQILHVTEDLALALTAGGEDSAGLALELQEDVERSARQQTEALLTDHDRRSLHATAAAITSERPAAAIVHYAQANRIDLIVMGMHGRGPLGRAAMGSVAERVVRTARCPVLTVHAVAPPRATGDRAATGVAEVH
jgi:nucleotide-binding universal stress UspA family protein